MGSSHSDDNDFDEVCDDKLPSALLDILVSHEDFNFKYLDLEYNSVK